MRVSHLILLAGAAVALPGAAMAAQAINVAPFRSVELREGGQVTVRAGSAQSVTLVEGDTRFTHFTVEHDGQLVIDTHCNSQCPDHYRIRVEIVSPSIAGLAVDEGGAIVASGTFPAQAEFSAAVNEGGHVDARAISAGRVHAAVNEGGNVMITATGVLTAAVNSGGHIQYWGNPSSIRRAVNDGGAINAGDGASADHARRESVVEIHRVHAVQPVRPVAPVAGTRTTHDSPDDYDDDYESDDMDSDEDAEDTDDSDNDSDE